MHLRDAKAALRDSIRERLSHQDEASHHAESRSVCRRIAELLPKAPFTICAYYPLKDEVDLRPLLLGLLKAGCDVCLPRHERNTMVFRKADTLEGLVKGDFGIPEPPESAALADPSKITIVLVPARAFSREGLRLGRGNGGYDIWIRKQRSLNPATKFWGVALEAQIVQEIPMEEHDERVDDVITARGRISRHD